LYANVLETAANRTQRQEVRPVRKSRYSDEQIAAALRQAEIGTPVAEITRKLGISEATFYVWKKRFGTLGTPEIRELRQLRDENAKLKAVVADLTLDRLGHVELDRDRTMPDFRGRGLTADEVTGPDVHPEAPGDQLSGDLLADSLVCARDEGDAINSHDPICCTVSAAGRRPWRAWHQFDHERR
jgi:putative transposase